MMKIGDRIRFFRIQQGKTQDELANGIISISYLSKIENNQSLPSLEVVDMLCERLGIRFLDEEEPTLLEELMVWYKRLVHGEIEAVKSTYPILKDKVISSNDSTTLIHFILFEFRYFLHIGEKEAAKKTLEKITQISDIFTDDLNYYYHKFIGLHEYMQEQYSYAYDSYKKAEGILLRNVFEKWEEADLYYSLGLTSSRLWKVTLCLNYTNQALAIYQAQYNFNRSAECQILLGISYRRTNDLKKAEESYLLADKIATTLNNSSFKGFIHHNLGYLYTIEGKSELAIKHYEKSILFHEQHNYKKTFPSIHCIIMEYFNKSDYSNGLRWVEVGLNKIPDSMDSMEYYYHFKTYQHLMSNANEESSEMEFFLKEKVIPYFESHNNYKYIAEYSEMLAGYYEKHFKYKNASLFYKLSNKSLKKINNI
ncbi:helix-turn-helix domain-containing protein [Bacillus salitolerans]|uniref:Helix-turn-helix domain-containing protein n=1 Tax=Bacillus salitolerans TaxID=1437434 RepID=A0ABW4LTE1_9BACI